MNIIKRTLYRFLERTTLKYKDTLIVLGQSEAKTATQQLHAPAHKIQIIPLGIDWDTHNLLTKTEAQKKLTRLLTQNIESYSLVGSIANFFPTKGLDILVQAIAKIQAQLPNNIKFILIGDGPEKQKITKLRDDLGLQDKIFFAGFQKNASELLKAFDLFVLPSRKEGFPYVILEAILAGVPVVATKVGGIPEILLHQKNSLLSQPNPQELGQNILFACQNPKKLSQLAETAKKIQTTHSQKQMIESTRALYQKHLGQNQ